MKLRFSKMQGLGNDFVVLDGVSTSITLMPVQIRHLADRHFGVGCDQILLVERARSPETADFRYRIFNADGGEVEHCGNGSRCFVHFVRDQGLTDKRTIRVETAKGLLELRLHDDGLVTVDMGEPCFVPVEIPFVAEAEAVTYPLAVGDHSVQISAVSMGNPHAVQVVDDVDTAPVERDGPLIERHARFPNRVNAGFMQIVNRGEIRLRVFERGVGETIACGTGACAAVAAGIARGLLDAHVLVHARGGDLRIEWAGRGHPLYMTGPAVKVFDGEIELAD